LRLRDFLTSIVQPNMQLALENPDDERHGINAILTIDALVGQLYEAMLTSNHPDVAGVKRDDEFRDKLAQRSDEYRLLRDLAAAYKHGQLRGAKPRLAHRGGQITNRKNTIGLFQVVDRLGSHVLVIELSDKRGHRRLSRVIGASYRFLKPVVEAVDP
jgi:hypothetical protein